MEKPALRHFYIKGLRNNYDNFYSILLCQEELPILVSKSKCYIFKLTPGLNYFLDLVRESGKFT